LYVRLLAVRDAANAVASANTDAGDRHPPQDGRTQPSRVSRRPLIDLNTPQAASRAQVVVPLLFGLWSVALGMDSNWDLRNYHLYNAYALLHEKLAIDFAPAGMQTYFNPLLDVPYYVLTRSLPAPVVGFLLGVIHGLNFVLVLHIARAVLPDLPARDRYRLPLLIALAGCLTANFLSELGNTMGDNTTSLFTLASLLILVTRWNALVVASRSGMRAVACAGAIIGLGVGLKLTNAPYALALAIGLVATLPGAWSVRLRMAFAFGLAALAGVCVTGGYWFATLWKAFGNPLFPQFSALFPNPLTQSVVVFDPHWTPRGWQEALLWPFVFSWNSHRVGQISIHQAIWPILYVLMGYRVVAAWAGRTGNAQPPRPGAALVVAFLAAGYVAWMFLFSIYRYVVAMELIAPLVVFLLLADVLPGVAARRTWRWTIGVATLLVLAGGFRTWGHEAWARRAFEADLPAVAEPENTTAILVGADPAWAWLATRFPDTVAFVQVGGSFPEGTAYASRIRQIVASRGGPAFAIFRGHADRVSTSGQPGDMRDVAADNRKEQEIADRILKRYGFQLLPGQCAAYTARIGQGAHVYQWCRVMSS
jgi:hypothetical protein